MARLRHAGGIRTRTQNKLECSSVRGDSLSAKGWHFVPVEVSGRQARRMMILERVNHGGPPTDLGRMWLMDFNGVQLHYTPHSPLPPSESKTSAIR